MYRVRKFFTDLKDSEHPYYVGDTYPREGLKVGEERIKELSGCNNRQRTPLIEAIDEPVEKKEVEPEINKPQEPVEKAPVEEKPKRKITRKTKK